MSEERFHFTRGVTLLGGGDVGAGDMESALEYAPNLVACDGAAALALASGVVPQKVIGDLDSLDAPTRARLDPAHIVQVSEQDSTDFDKALRACVAPLILGVGFLGGRLDHTLAALSSLVQHPRRVVLIGARDVCFHCPERLALDLPPGSRVSLMPMREVRAVSRGLVWPTDGLTLAPAGRIGTSNRVCADWRGPVEIVPEGPGLLVIVPRAALGAVVSALA
ncbi:MAG: thiamine diphosphokinase [Rhodobacterales bacterium]|nr:MAG: thiamine diphosphokinase [Rhodobacterales bacterium]